MEDKTKKYINFDLSSSLLKTNYNKSRRAAYREICSYMEKNGFIHRQYSAYISKNEMSVPQMTSFIDNFFNNLPWVEKCAKVFDVTNVPKDENFDVLEIRRISENIISDLKDMDSKISDKKKTFSKSELQAFVNEVKSNKNDNKALENNNVHIRNHEVKER